MITTICSLNYFHAGEKRKPEAVFLTKGNSLAFLLWGTACREPPP